MEHIVIIGNGVSGITCARHIRKHDSQKKITVISGETEHFYARTALMYIYMGHMKYEHTKPYEDRFWEKNRIELVFNNVSKVDTQNKKLSLSDGYTISYDKLVIATGSKTNFYNWPGQDLKGVQGLYNIEDLQTMEENTAGIKNAVVVGGGLIGIELAEMLLSRNLHVTFLVREKRYWSNILSKEEANMIERHMREHHIDLILETELKEIRGTNGKVSSIVTTSGEEIQCEFVGISTGVSPNISFLNGSNIETDKGVLVDRYFQTNTEDVYAIGDCAQFRQAIPGRKALEQVWYTGRMQGQVLAQTLCNNTTEYNPGPWFNSAKFLDIEYQNYGMLPAEATNDIEMFYWEHSSGKIAFRAGFEKATGKLIGINSFGFRLRHELFDRWLTGGRNIDEVMEHLADANFDPEFYRKYEADIINAYNKQFNKNIKAKKRSWSRIFQNMKRQEHASK
ncbi:MAG: NAD(P)/FAD-dependent oxidoreductase [Chitinophagaceae bacterium]|nr:NAD(P)/FAD-dependent oxidoreductase [Chitinophagaceae bacterium]